MPEGLRPLTPDKIAWYQRQIADLKARRPAIFWPVSEYWDDF